VMDLGTGVGGLLQSVIIRTHPAYTTEPCTYPELGSQNARYQPLPEEPLGPFTLHMEEPPMSQHFVGTWTRPVQRCGRAGRGERGRRALGIVAALSLFAGCSGSDEEAGAVDGNPRISTELRTTVDGYAAGFGRVGALVSDDQERIYVADLLANQVVVLSPDGTRVATFGGPGQGPAEFSGLAGTLAWMGESLVILDQRRQRFVYFGRDGAMVGSVTPTVGFLLPVSTLFSGSDHAIALLAFRERTPAVPGSTPTFAARYARLTADGELQELASVADVPQWPPSVDCMPRDESTIEILPIPFADWGPRRGVLSSGDILIAHDTRYQVDIVDPVSGSVIRSITREVPEVPITDEEWEADPGIQQLRSAEARSAGALVLATDGTAPCPLQGMRPASRPAIRALGVDDQDRIWIESTTADGFELSFVDSMGNVLGTGAMPARDSTVAPHVREDALYVVVKDALDVQSILVYDISMGAVP